MFRADVRVFIMLFFLSVLSAATCDALSSGDLLDQGKKDYDRGEYSQAVGSFSRAFLSDPQSIQAQHFLKSLASVKGLKANEQIFLLNFNEALDYLESLIRRQEYYQAQKDHLTGILLSSGLSQSDIDLRVSQQRPISIDNTDIESQETDPLKAVQSYLIRRKAVLTDELETTMVECNILAGLHSEARSVSLSQKRSEALNVPAGHSFDEKLSTVVPSVKDEDVLKGQFSHTLKQIDGFKTVLLEDQKNIKAMSDQMVDLTLQMAEKDASLLENGETIIRKEKKISDLEGQLQLSQEILSEKNSQLSSLSSQAQDKNDLSGQIKEMTGMLEIYKGKLAETNQKLDQKISILDKIGSQYDELKMQVFAKDTALIKTREQLALLQQEVEFMKREMEELRVKLSRRKGEFYASKTLDRSLQNSLKSIDQFIQTRYRSSSR